jgi:hypothetical protein
MQIRFAVRCVMIAGGLDQRKRTCPMLRTFALGVITSTFVAGPVSATDPPPFVNQPYARCVAQAMLPWALHQQAAGALPVDPLDAELALAAAEATPTCAFIGEIQVANIRSEHANLLTLIITYREKKNAGIWTLFPANDPFARDVRYHCPLEGVEKDVAQWIAEERIPASATVQQRLAEAFVLNGCLALDPEIYRTPLDLEPLARHLSSLLRWQPVKKSD